jgi:hypothetical protein
MKSPYCSSLIDQTPSFAFFMIVADMTAMLIVERHLLILDKTPLLAFAFHV